MIDDSTASQPSSIRDVIARRNQAACPICGNAAKRIGEKVGRWRPRTFHLARCAACAFGFVIDPETDFENIYNADYYRGKGADPLVDYEAEAALPGRSARDYELNGLLRYARAAAPLSPHERWLDFGSGLGSFVTFLRSQGLEAFGYEDGFAAGEARRRGVPVLSPTELSAAEGSFGVVSAIEVLEHVLEPLETLRQISRLLRPGGLFMYTTGNAAPFRRQLPRWSYVVPEIHISFYEPPTMRLLFERSGLSPLSPVKRSVMSEIIHYKILKNIGFKRGGAVDRFAPWPLLTNIADRRFQISDMILARKSAHVQTPS